MGMVANLPKFNLGVEVWMKKVRYMATLEFQKYVWDVFNRVLNQTPQFTGKAVANWNLSIGSPDFSYNDSLGDDLFITGRTGGMALARGDRRWIRHAQNRNRPIKDSIRANDKVYITNGVEGDDDEGRAATQYMEALQDSGYAARKLRAVNQPYENLQESVIVVSTRGLSKGLALPKLGGGSWE